MWYTLHPVTVLPANLVHGFHASAMVEDMQNLNCHMMQYTLLNLT